MSFLGNSSPHELKDCFFDVLLRAPTIHQEKLHAVPLLLLWFGENMFS